LIDKLSLPRSLFPSLVHPRSHIGSLRDDVAAEVGAALDAVGSHDTASAVVGGPMTGNHAPPTSRPVPGHWSASSLIDRCSRRRLESQLHQRGGVARIVVVALPRLRRSWVSPSARRAATGNFPSPRKLPTPRGEGRPDYLAQLESAVTARGGVVHWAPGAAEANRIVIDLSFVASGPSA
jgi:hypothetical protein